MLIGLLRKYEKPMVKDEVAAMVAKEYGAETIFFTANQIDFNNKLVHGISFQQGEWRKKVSYFPNVVYNDIPDRKDELIYSRLEAEGIPFTTHRLGRNKLSIQEKMMEDEVLSPYCIETVEYSNIDNFISALKKYQSVFVKPNRGHKGHGIHVFELSGEQVIYQDYDGKKTIFTVEQAGKFLSSIPQIEYYHLQPKISSKTLAGESFVIRSYVGRNGKGKWVNIFHYAAISLSGNSVVNVSRGSSISYIAPFLKSTFGERDKIILTELNTLSVSVAQRVQTFVNKKIDALGIDLGITNDGKIYIFEVNAFPGTRPFEALVEKFAVPYAIYLAKETGVV